MSNNAFGNRAIEGYFLDCDNRLISSARKEAEQAYNLSQVVGMTALDNELRQIHEGIRGVEFSDEAHAVSV